MAVLICTAILGSAAEIADAAPSRAMIKNRVRSAISALKTPTTALSVHWPAHRLRPTMISGLSFLAKGATLASRATAFLRANTDLLATGLGDLSLLDQRSTHTRRVLRYRQTYRGLPVIGTMVTVTFDQSGKIHALHQRTAAVNLATIAPKAKGRAAVIATFAALRVSPAATLLSQSATTLAVLVEGAPRLIHVVTLPYTVDPRGRRHFVDATDGRYLGHRPGVILEGVRR